MSHNTRGAVVATAKALVLKNRLQAIIPGAEIDARVSMFRAEDADSLLDITDITGITAGDPVPPGVCFVLDCIDDLVTKAELIAQCSKRGLRVLSSMGAGLKSDPTRLHIAKLADCCKDRLAMRVRVSVSVSVIANEGARERLLLCVGVLLLGFLPFPSFLLSFLVVPTFGADAVSVVSRTVVRLRPHEMFAARPSPIVLPAFY